MNKIKKFVAILLTLALTFSMVACSQPVVEEDEADKYPASEFKDEVVVVDESNAPIREVDDTVPMVTFPITVTDQAGREVTIQSQPVNIVSGYYISTSACLSLGIETFLVAIEEKADKRPIYSLAAPNMLYLPNVGSAKNFDLETCLAQSPDLVILPMKQKALADTLTEMGIPAIVVNPESHEQVLEMFDILGHAINVLYNSDEIIAYYQAKLDGISNIADIFRSVNECPVVYMGGTSSYLTTAPKDMYQASLIRSVGAVNASDSIEGSSWTNISYEQLIAMNPDVIIIPTNSLANGTPDYTVQDILNDKQLAEVTAVKNKAVYQMPVGFEAWDSPCPSGILGAYWLMMTVHPDACTKDDFIAEVQSFYSKFYDFTPSAKSILK